MDILRTEKLKFTYPKADKPALIDIDLGIASGAFIALCGPSGCGKTTLLRCLKREVAPHGNLLGEVYYYGEKLSSIDAKVSAQGIGFVRQDPDAQIVTDTVWHELAFGLENIGVETSIIRRRVAETAHFFGINTWFEKQVDTLSGGQKQILNLAAVMAMQPGVVILDEPTAQLDPIAAREFLVMISRVNRELGTTVILSEHRLEEVLPVSDKAILMENGRITMFADTADFIAHIAADKDHAFFGAMPSAVRISSTLGQSKNLPVTVREGRAWLKKHTAGVDFWKDIPHSAQKDKPDPVLAAKDVWFRYGADGDFVLRGLSCGVGPGRMLAIVGGNASGKTTALGALAGLNKPVRGSVKLDGKNIRKYKSGELYRRGIAMLSQDPKTMFVCDTVFDDLKESTDLIGDGQAGKVQIGKIAKAFGISHLLTKHPYDLSGGERQKAAIAKLLLLRPRVLLLDEPTKGIDIAAKRELAQILRARCDAGDAVAMVTHDIEFAARYADEVAMIFGGAVVSDGSAKEFFVGNTFYTTSANRISRGILPGAVVSEDVIRACKKEISR